MGAVLVSQWATETTSANCAPRHCHSQWMFSLVCLIEYDAQLGATISNTLVRVVFSKWDSATRVSSTKEPSSWSSVHLFKVIRHSNNEHRWPYRNGSSCRHCQSLWHLTFFATSVSVPDNFLWRQKGAHVALLPFAEVLRSSCIFTMFNETVVVMTTVVCSQPDDSSPLSDPRGKTTTCCSCCPCRGKKCSLKKVDEYLLNKYTSCVQAYSLKVMYKLRLSRTNDSVWVCCVSGFTLQSLLS